MARKKPSYEGKTELFDPLLEGDEIIERSDFSDDDDDDERTSTSSSEKGFLPALFQTAKDDLKLVGDVIKLAFAKR